MIFDVFLTPTMSTLSEDKDKDLTELRKTTVEYVELLQEFGEMMTDGGRAVDRRIIEELARIEVWFFALRDKIFGIH